MRIGTAITVIALGAILAQAVTLDLGFLDINVIGYITIFAGAAFLLWSIIEEVKEFSNERQKREVRMAEVLHDKEAMALQREQVLAQKEQKRSYPTSQPQRQSGYSDSEAPTQVGTHDQLFR